MTKSSLNTQQMATIEEIRMTPFELAQQLIQNPRFELSEGKSLIIQNMDLQDFFDVAKNTDPTQRLLVLSQMLNRFSLDVALEGSIAIGALNISDYSWTLSAGEKGPFRITAKTATFRRSIHDMASFLHLLPKGQGFALKPFQDLFLTGLSADALIEYYKFSQEQLDPQARERQQEQLFATECQLLAEKRQTLKIFGINTTQIDRVIDINTGGILFKAVGNNDQTPPTLVLGVVPFQS